MLIVRKVKEGSKEMVIISDGNPGDGNFHLRIKPDNVQYLIGDLIKALAKPKPTDKAVKPSVVQYQQNVSFPPLPTLTNEEARFHAMTRFTTGCESGKITIPNPAHITMIGGEPVVNPKVWFGNIEKFKFNSIYEEQFNCLKHKLAQQNRKFNYLGVLRFDGNSPNMYRFVAVAERPGYKPFLWEKYYGLSPAGGQNDVYVGGEHMHYSTYMGLNTNYQARLLNMSE